MTDLRDWLDYTNTAIQLALLASLIWYAVETLRIRRTANRQANAQVNAERAWLIVELVPLCTKFEKIGWCRFSAGRHVEMSQEELRRGEHLQHKLKITNMGRTPAFILQYEVTCFRPIGRGVTELVVGDLPYRSLGAGASIEMVEEVVDVHEFVSGHSDVVIFMGKVSYTHVFSHTEMIEEQFAYGFDRVAERLNPIATEKEQREEKIWYQRAMDYLDKVSEGPN